MKCNKGDWYEIINIERKNNDVIQSDEEIACMSWEKFKTLIDKKVEASAIGPSGVIAPAQRSGH
jgi:hypothetical protein